MHFNQRKARVARAVAFGSVTLGAATAITAQTHQAAAAGIFAALNSAITCATTDACVSGTDKATKGIGVEGTSNSNTGYGVEGTSKAGYGVVGVSEGTGTGVLGGGQSGWGVYGYSNKNDGVEGVSDNFYGVEGLSYALGGGAVGVKGSTASGQGYGVWGDGGFAGVYGTSQNGAGVIGNSDGSASTSIGVYGYSNVLPFSGWSENGNVFSVDASGNIFHTGSISSASRAADGTTVAAYSAKLTSPTVEDTGTAQLVGGSATVLLDPVFARTIDSASSYRVFLTADGDTHGLFVARKTAVGFAVRENEGGRSTVSFDYRIVATALGHAGQRMAVTKPRAETPFGSARRPSASLSKPAPLPSLP